jgi:hypothetical protein
MEPRGTVEIVKGIYERTGVKITNFLGDGDSRAFKEASAYAWSLPRKVRWIMTKLDCVNHVAKRIGTGLRNAVKTTKPTDENGKKLKGLGGRGGLTVKAINKIQSFYNFIIHECVGNPEKMSEWTLAMFDHISSSDADPKHNDCDPKYCKYLQAKKDGLKYEHSKHFHISMEVMKHVQGIFEDMADINLLQRVAHGKTQNANECFNSTVWNMMSKNGFANRPKAELVVDIATCKFNRGNNSLLKVLSDLHFPVGKEAAQAFKAIDKLRLAKKKKAEENKSRKRKRIDDDEDDADEQGVPSYAPGGH